MQDTPYLNEDKKAIFEYGLEFGLIKNFDIDTITKLKKIYYSFLSGYLYLYLMPTDNNRIGNKIEILSFAFKDEDYKIYHGITNTSKNKDDLDCHSWIEVTKGDKTLIYDPINMLTFNKNLFYKLEEPEIKRIVPKEQIETHPLRLEDLEQARYPHDLWLLTLLLKDLDDIIKDNPYKDIIKLELKRYQEEIHFNELENTSEKILKQY